MRLLNVFLYEFNHFRKNLSKVVTYLIFILASIYSLYNGFDLYQNQQATVTSIEEANNNKIEQVSNWFSRTQIAPNAVDVLGYIPSYQIKQPSPLLVLGIGQSEQYGFYKKITNWSSTYDNDMVEEIANPERLVNGNIDFSFLVIFLLPVLLIILTYNIQGFEQDFRFEKLIQIQFGSISKWVFIRFIFYVFLLIFTIIFFILTVAIVNNALMSHLSELIFLIILATIYILFFASILYLIILNSSGSSSIAFKMIGLWLLLCVIIPGSVHQFSSIKYPVNYMTDYLDSNRQETYEVFELPIDSLHERLVKVYPSLYQNDINKDYEINSNNRRNVICAIVNEMNKLAINKIENQNDSKNKLIESTYLFNPVLFVQNKWNYFTSTDYYSYQEYRDNVQKTIDNKLKLLIFEPWYDTKVTPNIFQNYLKELNNI